MVTVGYCGASEGDEEISCHMGHRATSLLPWLRIVDDGLNMFNRKAPSRHTLSYVAYSAHDSSGCSLMRARACSDALALAAYASSLGGHYVLVVSFF